MGMAASQARLLTITARLHDVEYKAQSIQNAKIQLATQQDKVYEDYLAALDASTLTIKDYNGNTITANFNNLCGINAVDTAKQYAFKTVKDDKLIVPEEIMKMYDDFQVDYPGGDAYAFAMYCMDAERFDGIDTEVAEEEIRDLHLEDDKTLQSYQSKMKQILSENSVEDYNELPDEKKDEYSEIESMFKYKLYQRYGNEIYNKVYENRGESDYDEFDANKFNYYVNMFKQIEACDGRCVSISSFDGSEFGDAANNSDWLKNMIQCGKITVSIVDENKNTGEVSLKTTTPDVDEYLGYTTTTTIDKTALAKAEAKYNHDTKELDQKDKKFDMDLSKLETERSALTTEYESVKKVINDNIERTFGIFS